MEIFTEIRNTRVVTVEQSSVLRNFLADVNDDLSVINFAGHKFRATPELFKVHFIY